MGLFEDAMRRRFGFPTQRESLDSQINNYRIQDSMAINSSLATRQKAISYFEEQIRQLERIINDNQVFIDAHETIKNKAIEKVKLPSNPLKSTVYDLNKKPLVTSNYSVIESYFETIKRQSSNPRLFSRYLEQQAQILEKMWRYYASKVIEGKGLYLSDDSDFGECYDIYLAYQEALNLMKAGRLKDENRESVNLTEIGMQFIIRSYHLCQKANSIIVNILTDFQIKLENVQSEQANDEYAKKAIEEAQAIMRSSNQYFVATKSEEFLKRLDELRK